MHFLINLNIIKKNCVNESGANQSMLGISNKKKKTTLGVISICDLYEKTYMLKYNLFQPEIISTQYKILYQRFKTNKVQ